MALEVHRFHETTLYVENAPKGHPEPEPLKHIHLFVGKSLSKEALKHLKNKIPAESRPLFILIGKYGRDMLSVYTDLLSSNVSFNSVFPTGFFTFVFGFKMSEKTAFLWSIREKQKNQNKHIVKPVEGSCMYPVIKSGEKVCFYFNETPTEGDIGLINGLPQKTHRIYKIGSVFGWEFILEGGDNASPTTTPSCHILGKVVLLSKNFS